MIIPIPVLVSLVTIWALIWFVVVYAFATAPSGDFQGAFETAALMIWGALNLGVGGVVGVVWLIAWLTGT